MGSCLTSATYEQLLSKQSHFMRTAVVRLLACGCRPAVDACVSALQSAVPACVQLSLQQGSIAQDSIQLGLRLQVGWSVEGLDRMRRQGAQHLPPLFGVLVAQYKAAGPVILHQVGAPALSCSSCRSPGAGLQGQPSLHQDRLCVFTASTLP